MTPMPPHLPEGKDFDAAPWAQDSWIAWTALLLDSYQQWTGLTLIPRRNLDEDARK